MSWIVVHRILRAWSAIERSIVGSPQTSSVYLLVSNIAIFGLRWFKHEPARVGYSAEDSSTPPAAVEQEGSTACSRTADHARSRVGSLAGDCSCTSPALAATVMSKSPPARGPSAAFLGLWPIGSGRRNMLNACGGSGRAYLEIARPHNLTPVQELWYMDEGGCLTDGQCSPLEKTETVCEATWIGAPERIQASDDAMKINAAGSDSLRSDMNQRGSSSHYWSQNIDAMQRKTHALVLMMPGCYVINWAKLLSVTGPKYMQPVNPLSWIDGKSLGVQPWKWTW
ncbi:hypothetical protein L227DRAFT_602533 [Lentinus tigrinus ALCF2SS1-6]|uniref:Uncharacterized protein n=1 Tax=Lentinus tigrinus ALCF2SS1-6 TaxID=1328759 RepID=A0A5C2S1Y0_9APHY|nr:hypothetical protein L227DRAFT_602533 [Lentinus tigrinus ALCF2SS1-6]